MSLVLIFSIHINTYASMCDLNFKPAVDVNYKEDFKLASRINFYENSIAVVRRLKTRRTYLEINEVKATYDRWFKNFKEVEAHIFKGSTDLAVYRLRKPYRNIHASTTKIQEYEQIIKKLRSNKDELDVTLLDDLNLSQTLKLNVSSKIKSSDYSRVNKYLHSKLRKEYRRLGGFFDEFTYYETSLNKLSASVECKAECKEILGKLKKELRVTKSAEEVRLLFNSSPDAIVVARKKEFFNETFNFVRKIISKIDFTKSLFQALKYKGIFEKSKLVRLFRGSYDRKARNLHRSIVDKISLADLTAKQRADLVKKELVTYTDESLLVNFSRMDDYYPKKAWNEIKDYASKSKDLEFYNLIQNAEAIGKRLGRIGAFNIGPIIKKAAIVIGLGAAVVYLLGSDSEVDILEVDDLDLPEQPATQSDSSDQDADDDTETQTIQLKYNSSEEADFYNFFKEVVDEIDQSGASQ